MRPLPLRQDGAASCGVCGFNMKRRNAIRVGLKSFPLYFAGCSSPNLSKRVDGRELSTVHFSYGDGFVFRSISGDRSHTLRPGFNCYFGHPFPDGERFLFGRHHADRLNRFSVVRRDSKELRTLPGPAIGGEWFFCHDLTLAARCEVQPGTNSPGPFTLMLYEPDRDILHKLDSFARVNINKRRYWRRRISWKPGSLILSVHDPYQIHTLNCVSGEKLSVLDGQWPSWSPDGETLAYVTKQGHLVLLNEKRTPGKGDRTWRFSEPVASAVSWSPDGKYLAVPLEPGWFRSLGDLVILNTETGEQLVADPIESKATIQSEVGLNYINFDDPTA